MQTACEGGVRNGHGEARGPLAAADGHARLQGPCGDTMEFWLATSGERLARVTYETDGCVSSEACGAATVRLAEGRRFEEAGELSPGDILNSLQWLPEEEEHCAVLAIETLRAALADVKAKKAPTPCAEEEPAQACSAEAAERKALDARLSRIAHTVMVLSGKGGVGKSTVAVNLAASLARSGARVGLLDVDIHGPSIPKMLGIEGAPITASSETGILPVEAAGLKVMSIGFFLKDRDDAVIWRGPMKMGVIRQFLAEVEWGDLDWLIIDSPPGTGDEPLSVVQLLGQPYGAVIVTTPQDVATADVRRSLTFCRQTGLPVLGVVENMAGFVCPKCGEVTDVFKGGGGERMALEMGVPFLGRIPLDPAVGGACDAGAPFVTENATSETARAFERVIARILGPKTSPCACGESRETAKPGTRSI